MLRLVDTLNPIHTLPKNTCHLAQTIFHLNAKLHEVNSLLTYIFHDRKKKEKQNKTTTAKNCRMRKLNPHLSLPISSIPVLCALSLRVSRESVNIVSKHKEYAITELPLAPFSKRVLVLILSYQNAFSFACE